MQPVLTVESISEIFTKFNSGTWFKNNNKQVSFMCKRLLLAFGRRQLDYVKKKTKLWKGGGHM